MEESSRAQRQRRFFLSHIGATEKKVAANETFLNFYRLTK
jgi:hypothetical protein